MGKFYRLFFYSCVLSFHVVWFAFPMEKRPFLLLPCPDPTLLPQECAGASSQPRQPLTNTLCTHLRRP